MNKPIIYSLAQSRSFDLLSGWNDAVTGLGTLAGDVWSGSAGAGVPPLVTGFAATPGSGLTVALGAGVVYALAALDANPYGSLGATASTVVHQGTAPAQTVTLTTAGLASGQSQWALIEVGFAQVDAVRAGDPTGGVLPYYDAANPSVPLWGPANTGVAQPTVRQDTATVRVLYGAPAASNPTPPAPDSGYVPLYYVSLTYGQSAITAANLYPGYGVTAPSSAGTVVPPFGAGVTRPVAKQTMAVTATNTAAATTLWSAVIPPGLVGPTSTLRLRASGTLLNNTGSAQNLTITYALSGATALSTGTVALSANSAALPWMLDVSLTMAGSTSAQFLDGLLRLGPAGDTGGTMGTATTLAGTGTAAVTFASPQTLSVVAQFGAASSALTIVLARALLELIP